MIKWLPIKQVNFFIIGRLSKQVLGINNHNNIPYFEAKGVSAYGKAVRELNDQLSSYYFGKENNEIEEINENWFH